MHQNLSDYFSHPDATLRSTSGSDVARLVGIINDAYSYQDEVKGEPRTNRDHLQKRISETDFYAIRSGDEIIGCVYLEPKDLELHFGLLTLAQQFRKKGIAEAVMKAIDSYAIENDFDAINLDYMSLAPWLKKYYEKYGFIETGQIEPWGNINLVRMRKYCHK